MPGFVMGEQLAWLHVDGKRINIEGEDKGIPIEKAMAWAGNYDATVHKVTLVDLDGKEIDVKQMRKRIEEEALAKARQASFHVPKAAPFSHEEVLANSRELLKSMLQFDEVAADAAAYLTGALDMLNGSSGDPARLLQNIDVISKRLASLGWKAPASVEQLAERAFKKA